MIIKTKDNLFVDVSNGSLHIGSDGGVIFTPHSGKKITLQEPQSPDETILNPSVIADRYEHAIVHGHPLFEL